MEGEFDMDVTLLSKIQSSVQLTGVHRLFVAHLDAFTPLLKPSATGAAKKPGRSSKSKPPNDVPSVRSLAKQYLSFIHKSLSILPKRLSESPKIALDCALELFPIYRLCLDCLDVIAPELAGKPFSVQIQRIRYMHCLEYWELFKEAEAEGYFVLESLNVILGGGLKGNSRKSKARLVPKLNEGNVDRDAAPVILEVVVTLVKCTSKRMSKSADDYRRVMSLVTESESWFKILDAKDYDKFHKFLETNLHIITIFLVAEIKSFSMDLIREFSMITLKEYQKSSAHDQMYKVALKMCSSLFSQRDELPSNTILDVLIHVLDIMSAECKVGEDKVNLGFMELVCYCANKCHNTNILCFPVAEHLYKLAGAFHEDFQVMSSILRLYVTGLLSSSSCNQLKVKDKEKCRNAPFGSESKVLLDDKVHLQQVAASINLLNGQIDIGSKEKKSYKRGSSLSLSYWEALKFLCESLAESIYSNRKEFFSEAERTSYWDDLGIIYNVFDQFSNIFLHCLSASEREKETSGENHRVISVVVVAVLMISFKTSQKIKESTLLVKQLISAEWVPVKRLKYLYVSLNNVAVILNRKKRLKEATKALNLCCRASWNYVANICRMHTDKHVSNDDTSEKAIKDFVMEASEKIVFLVELSRECNCKLNGIIKESLKCWLVAEDLIATIPVPTSLVKEWVKMQFSLSMDANREHGILIYTLLPSSKELSRRAHAKILEEELRAYDEKCYLNPSYSFRMQMEIIDILLKECYAMKDGSVNISRILIEKGKVLRAHGVTQLKECIQCLSDAISALKSIYCTKKGCNSQVHHLLIQAYILRALCTHEAAPNSVVLSPRSNLLDDVDAALKILLSQDHDHANGLYHDMLYLWYQVIDLLSIKGYLELHPSLYDAVIKLHKEKNLPLTKIISELWKSRRLSHALCASPVNDMFSRTFSKYQNQLFNSSGFWKMCKEELKPLVVVFHHTNDELKQVASGLTSHVPKASHSIFLSANIHHELSERLISCGQMTEALTHAKEALRLRSKLLRQNFEYSVEKIAETFEEDGKTIEKSCYSVQSFKVNNIEATKGSRCSEDSVETPWNVLNCYLESILQVGFVQEILGDVSEAEMLLRWGRNVSQFQALPLFEIAFSSMLGKLCRKQKLWGMAEEELFSAKRILAVNNDIISCKRCSCILEISINQQLGDLFLSWSCSTEELPSAKRLLDAQNSYKSALVKLNLSEHGISYCTNDGNRSEQAACNESFPISCALNHAEVSDSLPCAISETKIQPRRSRRTKKEVKTASESQGLTSGSRRITRSSRCSLESTHKIVPGDRQVDSGACLATAHMSTATAGFDHNVSNSGSKYPAAEFQQNVKSLCSKLKCFHCLHIEAADCNSISNLICMNWGFVYRRVSLRLLLSIGKITGICDSAHDAHEILLQGVSVLFNRNSNCSKYSSGSLIVLIESIGKNFSGDLLAVECAALVYYICWFSLKCYSNHAPRNSCCELSGIGTEKIISWLKTSFVLCREVPVLFQKVSRLLATIYVLCTSSKQFSLSPHEEGFESWWASFFHQASLGTHVNQHIVTGMMLKTQCQITSDSEETFPNSESTRPDVPDALRSAPESSEDLEKFAHKFFQGLPSTPVICISLVSGLDACLFRQLLHTSATVKAWILLSHLSLDDQHIVLLPICTTLEASEDDASSSSTVFNCKDFVKKWHCPWVSSVIDDIAPVFRHVLEGSYYSSSEYFLESIKQNSSLWWMQRNKLDECLSKFLQDIEDYWLGPWKYLLLGEWPDCNYLDSVQKNLFEDDENFLQLVAAKKCYADRGPDESSKSSTACKNKLESLFRRMLKISDDVEEVECSNGKPIILVLDIELQMLPWENLPILRSQEVYRMPSVGSILATLERCLRQNHEQFQPFVPAFPLIDPLDSYYLLNPDGDLKRTQDEFENWFKDQNIEGKIGTVPTIEELTRALKSHDLFIYFGHGSGTQYIPGHEIQKLDKCAASLLLGCSSGSLFLRGCYMPQGAPISYLLAGSPVIIANLWEVTDKDIDRFGKAMLNAWLSERSDGCCDECGEPRKCMHGRRRRVGSFMGGARDACALRYLIGAAPVCYGVPTGIIKRKDSKV
ncbi:separase isoform X2 [Andrographis paniculata]|uniref:separase isoform X2 n=1 Tax=Andrographis paniculata TaxID=175694 RepID=UPI0021E90D3B|nr:separase isoform X2 [Andrographis paniculata]